MTKQKVARSSPTQKAVHMGDLSNYYHQEVHYTREGQEEVPYNTLKVFRFVKEAFFIPDDFDKDHRVSAPLANKWTNLCGMDHL